MYIYERIKMMLRVFLLLVLQLGYAFADGILFLGNNASYEVLSYSEYSAVKDMDELPHDLEHNLWYKNKRDFKRDKNHLFYG